MKFLIVFALFAGAFAAPNYGYGSPDIRITSTYNPAIVRAAPYAAELHHFEEPIVKVDSYGYGAPALRAVEHIPIIRHLQNDDNYGTYNLDIETGNGIRNSETGTLANVGGPDAEGPVSVKSGSYSYISPEGIPITTTWTADENGFHASGAHLPVPPPIPAEIARSLHASAYGAAPALAFRSSAYSHEPLLVRAPLY